MDLLEKPVYNYIKNNHGVITFRDMEELNFSYQQLNPFEPVMTFPFGTNTRPMKEAGVKPIVARKYHEIGIIRLERQAGQFISVYDMERTLVECLRTAYHVDIQVIAPAFQAYFKKGAVDYAKLYHYAQLFKVTEKLQSYVEVLS